VAASCAADDHLLGLGRTPSESIRILVCTDSCSIRICQYERDRFGATKKKKLKVYNMCEICFSSCRCITYSISVGVPAADAENSHENVTLSCIPILCQRFQFLVSLTNQSTPAQIVGLVATTVIYRKHVNMIKSADSVPSSELLLNECILCYGLRTT